MKPPAGLWALAAMTALLAVPVAYGADDALPDWARPTPPPVAVPRPADDGQPRSIPGSTVSYTQKQIDNSRMAKDWFPATHPPMPPIVAGAEDAKVFACAHCHLVNGNGHPESAALAGLPKSYFTGQLAAMADGSRKAIGPMNRIAAALSRADAEAAATYFTQLKPTPWVQVVETATVAPTFVRDFMRQPVPGASPEPLGHRIIELPQDVARVADRDPRVGFVAYVPSGSIAAGRALVAGSGATACAACHGSGLHGNAGVMGGVPWIAGRSPVYVYRQLWDFKHGARNGPADAPMKGVAANLTDDQMIDIAAYLGTLRPEGTPQ